MASAAAGGRGHRHPVRLGRGLLFHRKSGLLDRAALRQAVPWGLLTAAAGAWAASVVDTELLRKPFGIYLLVMGVMTLVKK